MREILFRGKQENNEWAEGSLIIWGDGSCSIETGCLTEPMASVIPETVGQFTGLTDKKGKKIYEGDIVMGAYKGKGVVEFTTEDVASCGCCFPYFAGSGFKAYDVNLGDCEVIGNIHDNTEILEKK